MCSLVHVKGIFVKKSLLTLVCHESVCFSSLFSSWCGAECSTYFFSRIDIFLKSCTELISWISAKSSQLAESCIDTNQEKIRALQRRHQVKF